MTEKLMILGAGIYQVPLIKKAKEMGLKVIVVSYPGNYPGFLLADQIYFEDTTNEDRIAAIAREEQIQGICTSGTDVAIRTLGKVVDNLGLKGPSCQAAIYTTNKLAMKQRFINGKVRTANYYQVDSMVETLAAYQRLSSPVIFKAVDSSGSRGIINVSFESEINAAYEYAKKASKMDYFIVEEFLDGIQCGAQSFIYQGQIRFILPHGDLVYQGKTAVPTGHYIPYELPPSTIADLETQLTLSIKALEIDNCAINADFILCRGQVYVLEIGARAGATCLPELVSLYYGIDYYEWIINAALGVEPVFSASGTQSCAAEILTAPRSGRIISISNQNPVNENIIDISFDYQRGDTVRKFEVGPDRIGQIIVKGETAGEALALLEQVKSRIDLGISVTDSVAAAK